jgi:tRNA dimethylallyltransferase
MKNKPILTFIVGPTACGKSQLALELAQKNKGAIVNADSVQVYKHLNIGSAKPTLNEQALVPHFLYDLVEPSQVFTAGNYRRAAMEIIDTYADKMPLYFVGGSGFYIQALEKGMYEVEPPTPEIVALLDDWEKQGTLYQELHVRDPKTAGRLPEGDLYRIRRALEITLTTGRPFSDVDSQFKSQTSELLKRFDIKKIGIMIDRAQLRQRVEERTRKMLQAGLLDEVKDLLARGYGDSRALQSVGYKECLAYLAGQQNPEELFQNIVTSTMQLAKKQMTWFRRDIAIQWQQARIS